MGTVTLTIDQTQVKVGESSTVLEAAQTAGIYIPTLCYHPDLPSFEKVRPVDIVYRGGQPIEGTNGRYEGCRLCVVEIEGMEGFPTACTTTVGQGMVVHTNTERVQELRRDNLKLILAKHPHACLLCAERAGCSRELCSLEVDPLERCCPLLGHCELQKVAEYIGIKKDTPRYIFRGLPIVKDEPFFDRDYSLCVGCTRCVRVCQEVRGVGAIGIVCLDGEIVVGTKGPSLRESGCRFCGACVQLCPTGALVDHDVIVAEREKALVPCIYACPAGINVPRYIRLIAEGRFAEAAAVIREKVPFPAVLGRVCTHPCESKCRRGELNEPIAICALKRVAAEHDRGLWKASAKTALPTGKRVAIVGSGPAGLTAAYYLAKQGHSVTVFEALPKPGGMMRVGIPKHRLPGNVLDAEIEEIRQVGVDMKTSTRVDSLDDLFKQGFSAIFLALGTHRRIKMSVDGEDSQRVLVDQMPEIPDQFGLRIGGGNTLQVDPDTLFTGKEGVFAGGDVVSGPASVIEAIAAGRQAAMSIDNYLGGSGTIDEQLIQIEKPSPWLGPGDDFADRGRVQMPRVPIGLRKRSSSFAEMNLGFSEEIAIQEAKRCLQCDLRLQISPVTSPPEKCLEFNPNNVNALPELECVYQLLDDQKAVIYIAGTMNLRQELREHLGATEGLINKARYFRYEENPMYTARESELIQQFIQEHGTMPEGNKEMLDIF